MGLFGSKKNEVLPKVSDIFSAGDLQKIKDTLGQKSATGSYGKYGDMAKTLLQVVEAPQKDYTNREWNGIIFAAGAMTKIEPGLEPILKGAVDRFHAFKKK